MSVAIAALNVFLCSKLFSIEYLNQLGSIEGSFIAISRYTIDHFGDLAWWPLWFGGMPYQNVYGPVLHTVVALVAVLLKISPALAFHKTIAFLYCFGSVTLFWLIHRLSKSLACGFWAALLYSVISPAAILIPAVRNDIGGIWHLRRLYNVVVYGESPHIASLALMPLALLAIDASFQRRKPIYFGLAAVSVGMLALTNITGLVGFAILLISYVLAMRRSILKVALIALVAYAITLPWLPPSTIRLILENSQHSQGSNYPIRLFALAILIAAAVLFTWLPMNSFLRFAVLVTLLAGAIVLPAFWLKFNIVPQPERFQLEFEMGFCLVAGFFLSKLRSIVPASVLVVLCLIALFNDRAFANRLIQPIDIRKTIEYREARWFDQNMSGRRVFAPGSISFWMNVFTDTPQFGGCCDQGVPNWQQRIALYTIYTGQNLGVRDAEVSLLWLQAYGVHAIGVSRRGSREWYKPFGNPDKFEGVLFVLWEDDSDVVYRVPLYSDSLAHVITEAQRISQAPKDGSDVDPLRPYVAAINDPQAPQAEVQWFGSTRASITAPLRERDLLSVQVTYDPGWRAFVNGAERQVESDALGMIIIHPDCVGRCSVDLRYDRWAAFRRAYK